MNTHPDRPGLKDTSVLTELDFLPLGPAALRAAPWLIAACDRFGIENPIDRAYFLATLGHESGFQPIRENMRYSAERLTQVWPSRFPTLASALPYAWDPTDPDREDVALANKTYGARLGNQDDGTDDSDGWDFRGGGMIQLTGKANWRAASRGIFGDDRLLTDPSLIDRIDVAALSAGYYWQSRGLSRYATDADAHSLSSIVEGFRRVSNAVNRGDGDAAGFPVGWEDRLRWLDKTLPAMGVG